jgi:hypothetical protein
MVYDNRDVPIHGVNGARILLVNEAPGPQEAEYRKPLIGSQGGNLYRTLRAAGVPWASEFNAGQKFDWPTKAQTRYKNLASTKSSFGLREQFLHLRQHHIACTNSFPRWPKLSIDSNGFVAPQASDVLSAENLQRLKRECALSDFHVLLLCGQYSYLAFLGRPIQNASKLERTQLPHMDLDAINKRLRSRFKCAFYMGHTRRWSLSQQATCRTMKEISGLVGWE